MTLLNERYSYGLDLCLLSIDEGISGYRDASLDVCLSSLSSFPTARADARRALGEQTVKRNAEQYGLPLKILSYHELYGGWTMDKVVGEIGKKGNCASFCALALPFRRVRLADLRGDLGIGTYCGVFRRQALDRGAQILAVDHVVTGHNADDVAETVLMNGASAAFAPSFPLPELTTILFLQYYEVTSRVWSGVQPSRRAQTWHR